MGLIDRHRRPPWSQVTAILVLATALLGMLVIPAEARDDPDLSAVHRITAEFHSYTVDDDDCVFACVFEPPTALPPEDLGPTPSAQSVPEGVITRTFDLATLVDPSGGPLHDPNALRRGWWRGPFEDASGTGILPSHDDAHLCFRYQAADWALHPGNAVTVTTHVGFFVGNPRCEESDLIAESDLTVTAAPNGQEMCAPWWEAKEDGGDIAAAALCLRNERVDPRPIASTRNGNSGTAPFTIQLDGSPSIVPDGVAVWHWTFGDGHTAVSGPAVNHLYAAPGVYPVTLQVTDTNGLVRSAGVMTVTVHAPATGPTARIAGPSGIGVGPATFDASASTPGSGRAGAIIEYWWDFGDGTQAITRAPTASATHAFTTAGTYSVQVTVHTADLRTSTASRLITVLPPATGGGTGVPIDPGRLPGGQETGPTAVIQAPPVGEEDQPVTFDGLASLPGSGPDGVLVSYAWDFGDGTAVTRANGSPVTHIYDHDDEYTVTLAVVTRDGRTDTDQHDIEIAD